MMTIEGYDGRSGAPLLRRLRGGGAGDRGEGLSNHLRPTAGLRGIGEGGIPGERIHPPTRRGVGRAERPPEVSGGRGGTADRLRRLRVRVATGPVSIAQSTLEAFRRGTGFPA